MPTIQIKTKYVRKLKELGVYDQWLTNIKNSMLDGDRNSMKFEIWGDVIGGAFEWSATPEGSGFWEDISEK